MTSRDWGTHLRYTVTGVWHVDNILQLARMMAVALAATPHKRVLIDLMRVQGSLNMEERYRMGSSLGPIFAQAHKVAVVQEIREQNGYAAKIANRRGSKIQVFSHNDDAELWITS